jgi:hypothetical protein
MFYPDHGKTHRNTIYNAAGFCFRGMTLCGENRFCYFNRRIRGAQGVAPAISTENNVFTQPAIIKNHKIRSSARLQ